MKKLLNSVLSLLVVTVLALCTFPLTASAAAATTIAFSKSSISVGDTLTVTIRVSEKNLSGTDVVINYNEELLTYVSGADGGAGTLKIVDDKLTGSESSATYKITFKAKKAGSASISVSGMVASGIPPEDVPLAGASASVTVKDVTLSSNANLKAMSVSAGSLSPRFSPSVTSYTVNVEKAVTDCKIYVTAAESEANVSVSGSSKLEIGDNRRVVTVTAPSGNKKEYVVNIKRSDVDQPDEDETPESLKTVIDGVSYTVMKDISSVSLPAGFNVKKRVYDKEDINIAEDKDGNYTLFYLKKSGSNQAIPYTYDEQANVFKMVKIYEQGANKYILEEIPDDFDIPEGFYSANVDIGGHNVECFASSNESMKDMYYLYCFFGGKFETYRYDASQNVLQRSPEINIAENTVTAVTKAEENGGSFLSRFSMLSSNAKTILVCVAVLAIGIIALLVLLIVKLAKRGYPQDFDDDDFDEDFDTVSFENGYNLISDDNDE